jgi:NADH-quinone oxidoreductase subunit E
MLGRPVDPKPETVRAIDELITHYPRKEAALIPAMHILQEEIKWMPMEAMDWIADKLEIPKVRVYGVGETTEDGKITLSEVECLGSCGTAPVMLVNDKFYENLTPKKIDALLDRIQRASIVPKAGDHG